MTKNIYSCPSVLDPMQWKLVNLGKRQEAKHYQSIITSYTLLVFLFSSSGAATSVYNWETFFFYLENPLPLCNLHKVFLLSLLWPSTFREGAIMSNCCIGSLEPRWVVADYNLTATLGYKYNFGPKNRIWTPFDSILLILTLETQFESFWPCLWHNLTHIIQFDWNHSV